MRLPRFAPCLTTLGKPQRPIPSGTFRWLTRPRQSLQTSAGILKHHTTYLLDILNKHSLLFQRLAIRPSTNYPGRTQENVLMTLLRKKLEPEIETLVEAARDEALAAGISPTQSFISQERLLAEKERERAERRAAKFGGFAEESDDEEEDDEDDENGSGDDGLPEDEGGDRVNEPLGIGDVWVDSFRYCREQLKRFADEFGEDLYTAEERAMGVENVRTGLKRSLEEESDDEEEEEEEEESEDDNDDDEEDGEGDTAMRDMAPIAPSSGQPAGQPGMGGTAGGAGQNGAATGPLPGEDPEWMLAFVARGDEELPKAMLEAQRSQMQRR